MNSTCHEASAPTTGSDGCVRSAQAISRLPTYTARPPPMTSVPVVLMYWLLVSEVSVDVGVSASMMRVAFWETLKSQATASGARRAPPF